MLEFLFQRILVYNTWKIQFYLIYSFISVLFIVVSISIKYSFNEFKSRFFGFSFSYKIRLCSIKMEVVLLLGKICKRFRLQILWWYSRRGMEIYKAKFQITVLGDLISLFPKIILTIAEFFFQPNSTVHILILISNLILLTFSFWWAWLWIVNSLVHVFIKYSVLVVRLGAESLSNIRGHN